MDVQQILRQLYVRFPAVAPGFGERFLPLLERACNTDPQVRARILSLIEASFEKEAGRKREELALAAAQEQRVLKTVAGVLHSWKPPEWLLDFRR